MDWLTFIAEMTKALAWPSALVAVVLIFRRSLRQLLPELQRLKYKDFELEFSRRIAALEVQVAEAPALPPPADSQPRAQEATLASSLEPVLSVSPRAAVIDAWRAIEFELEDAFRRRGLPQSKYPAIERRLFERQELPPRLQSAIGELRSLRNAAAHEPEMQLSPQQARDYVALADRVIAQLRAVLAHALPEATGV